MRAAADLQMRQIYNLAEFAFWAILMAANFSHYMVIQLTRKVEGIRNDNQSLSPDILLTCICPFPVITNPLKILGYILMS